MIELRYTSIEQCIEGTLLHYENGKSMGILVSKEYTELKGYRNMPYWFWMLGILSTEGFYFDIELGKNYRLFF